MGAHTMASQGGGGVGGRQGSAAYGVALDEVETHLGEPLHSMNLDDLLRHVLPSDLGSTTASSTAGHSQRHGVEHLVGASASDIHRGGRRRLPEGGGGGERPPALGEVTLEDFLSRAGAAAEEGGGGGGDSVQRNHHQPGITGIYVTRPLAPAPAPAPARKRAAAPAAEKTVERRQKRMIKNRESAARSRARRQAYTNELENKVSHLEEENERLRKEQQLEPLVHYAPQQEQKHQLHRTSSAPF
ncbi:ABSCISIC ACID-INSENSITIVE 5-like protein 2 [Ananas comosus]|uniref:ABSCISIC ACID-INSENSITIVE 5-like protein 2 n=1 Tax=Ananas comosus TaxID=4615 RepID=A0A6P5GJZ0_ANACO|nr:ABSCISIC ACID-INSENSITIVE 5-like protein 2 [Ananas comosus]XP_020108091.1 ABSCISIC ACID-INSENSITIVE 5-like protein 2 [Ananas comosus]XP_020108092.1 ABSCISIC ACID-INSENSITIVE 5-like protein 2 [Ananas comosus]